LQLCHQRLNVLHNYFDGATKFFSDPAKFLDILTKVFFPNFLCKFYVNLGIYGLLKIEDLLQYFALITTRYNDFYFIEAVCSFC